jgi:hypothetical protein
MTIKELEKELERETHMEHPELRYWPVWGVIGWYILDRYTGDVLRKPPQGRMHEAIRFRDADKAQAAANKLNAKLVKEEHHDNQRA